MTDPQTKALQLAAYLDRTLAVEANTDAHAEALLLRIGEAAGGLGDSLVADVQWLMDNAEDEVITESRWPDYQRAGADDYCDWLSAETEARVQRARDAVARAWLEVVEPMVAAAKMERVA